jgi:hypothetical protein
MTNNCLAVPESELSQDRPDIEAGDEQQRLAERFEEALARCKDEAGCLDDSLWEELDEREKGARLLAAMGFASKATRYRDCHVTGVPVDCPACRERYFSRYRCTLRYCEHCGPLHFSRLLEKYREPISRLIAEQPSQQGRTLAMLTFTVRAYDRMPDPSEPRRLLKLVRRWFRRVMPEGTRWVWGCIYAIETGHELGVKHPGRTADGWNLHVHVLYFGPYLDWTAGLELWKELTAGDGQGFYIKQCPGWRKNPDQAVRRALVHHFGYILKPAAVSGERIAALEVLFSGVRRVHALGCFYRLPKVQKDVVNPRCPKCGQDLPINLRAWHKNERVRIADLEGQGRMDWRAVESEIRRAQAFGGRAP